MKRIHYDHHAFPNDSKLLFLPICYSLPQMLAISAVTYMFFDDIAYALGIYAGLSLALLYYEWTHYVAHCPVQPRTPWGKWMKKIHLWHHYKNENYWYGITDPALDMMFARSNTKKICHAVKQRSN